jgi:hypothetical protein
MPNCSTSTSIPKAKDTPVERSNMMPVMPSDNYTPEAADLIMTEYSIYLIKVYVQYY